MRLSSTLDPELMLHPENLPRASTVAMTKEYSFLRTSVPRGPKVGSLGLLTHAKDKKSSKSSKIRSLADYRTEDGSVSSGLAPAANSVVSSLKQSRGSTSVVSEVSPSPETDGRLKNASLTGDSVSEADGNESDSSSHSSLSTRGTYCVLENVVTQGAAYLVNGQEIATEALGQFPSIKDVLQAAAAEHQDQGQEVNGEVRSRRDSICSRWAVAQPPALHSEYCQPQRFFFNTICSVHTSISLTALCFKSRMTQATAWDVAHPVFQCLYFVSASALMFMGLVLPESALVATAGRACYGRQPYLISAHSQSLLIF